MCYGQVLEEKGSGYRIVTGISKRDGDLENNWSRDQVTLVRRIETLNP